MKIEIADVYSIGILEGNTYFRPMKLKTPNPPFTNLQAELLKMFSSNLPEKKLTEVKELLAEYFVKQAIESATHSATEKGYTQQDYRNWVNDDGC